MNYGTLYSIKSCLSNYPKPLYNVILNKLTSTNHTYYINLYSNNLKKHPITKLQKLTNNNLTWQKNSPPKLKTYSKVKFFINTSLTTTTKLPLPLYNLRGGLISSLKHFLIKTSYIKNYDNIFTKFISLFIDKNHKKPINTDFLYNNLYDINLSNYFIKAYVLKKNYSNITPINFTNNNSVLTGVLTTIYSSSLVSRGCVLRNFPYMNGLGSNPSVNCPYNYGKYHTSLKSVNYFSNKHNYFNYKTIPNNKKPVIYTSNISSINKFFIKNTEKTTKYNFFYTNDFFRKRLLFFSRNNLKFTLVNIGLFITNNNTLYSSLNTKNINTLFKLKKKLYSFNKPNQIKSLILQRKSLITLNYLLFYRNNVLLTNILPSLGLKFKLLYFRFINNFIKTSDNIKGNNYSYIFEKKINDSSYFEVKLNRVKFKPGYQRIWRDSRLALKELIGLKFIYQKQLTKYLVRFYKKSNLKLFVTNDLSLHKVIIYSRLVTDYNTFTLFFNSNLFFINGMKPHTRDITLVINDFIQLVVSKWYYIFFRWTLHFSLLRVNKLKKLIYRKGLSSRYKIMKSRKQKSLNIPDWIFSTKYDFSDIKPFLEVDYFTLSFLVLYEPYINHYYTPVNLFYPRSNIYRLYNWKYIT